MSNSVVLLGIIDIVISLITGLFLFYFCFKLFLFFTKKIDSNKQLLGNNTAMAFLLIGLILGVMIIIRSTVIATMENFSILLNQENVSFIIIFNIIFRILISFVFAGIIGFIIVWLSFLVFTFLTKDIDEIEDIKNSNTAIALVLGTFIVSAAFLAQTPVTTILNSIVADPTRIHIAIMGFIADENLIIEGALELLLWIFGILFVFVIGYRIVPLVTKNIDENAEIKKNNMAVALFISSFIFSIMLFINAALHPSFALLQSIIKAKTVTFALIAVSIIKIVLFFLGSGLLAFGILNAALFFFMFLTRKINELEEIKKNNAAIGLVVALFVIVLALLIENSLGLFLSGFVVS